MNLDTRGTAVPISWDELEGDALIVAVQVGEGNHQVEFLPQAAEVNRCTEGLLQRLIDQGEITANSLALCRILAPHRLKVKSLIVVGLGERPQTTPGLAFRVGGCVAKLLATKPRRRVIWAVGLDDVADLMAGLVVGSAGQDLYRKQKKLFPLEDNLIVNADPSQLLRGLVIGNAINMARRWVNQPPNELYPESFAEECVKLGQASGLAVEVWDADRLNRERCGALLAVARGSQRSPRLVILKYHGAGPDQPVFGLVGKGVTFDSGGYSLKPNEGMLDMKCDMAGAATVVAAMSALAKLKVPANVVGVVGLVENLVSGQAFKLGDVLTARNGKTIEVLNTDAEGRLVLADALDVAGELGVERIVDLATLTGACLVALGKHVAGAMTNHDGWFRDVAAAAEQCGEPLWQLPMFPEYADQIRSSVADLKNVGDGRWGGAITAAKFLEEFVGGRPWVHLDIAGPAFSDKGSAWVDGGASGAFVRTLVQLIENQV